MKTKLFRLKNCWKKGRHSQVRAEWIAYNLRQETGVDAIKAYECKICNSWHIGKSNRPADVAQR